MLLETLTLVIIISEKSVCRSQSVNFRNVTDAISLPTYSNWEDNGWPSLTIYKDLSSSINYIWWTQATRNNGTWNYQYLSNIYDIYGQQYNANNPIKSTLPITLSYQPDSPELFSTISPTTNDIVICYYDLSNYTYKCQLYLNQKQTLLPAKIVANDTNSLLPQVLCLQDVYIIFWISHNNDCTDINIMYDVWDLNGVTIRKDISLINIAKYIGHQQCPWNWKLAAKDKNFVIEFEGFMNEQGQAQTIEFISGFYTNSTNSEPAQVRIISSLSNTNSTTDTVYHLYDVKSINISTECCFISLYNNGTLESIWDEVKTYMSVSNIFGNNVFGNEDIYITNLTAGYNAISVLGLSEKIVSIFGVMYPILDQDGYNYKLIVQVYQLIDNNGEVSLNKIGSPQTMLNTKGGGYLCDIFPQIVFDSNIHHDTSLFITWESCDSSQELVMVESWNVSIAISDLSEDEFGNVNK